MLVNRKFTFNSKNCFAKTEFEKSTCMKICLNKKQQRSNIRTRIHRMIEQKMQQSNITRRAYEKQQKLHIKKAKNIIL